MSRIGTSFFVASIATGLLLMYLMFSWALKADDYSLNGIVYAVGHELDGFVVGVREDGRMIVRSTDDWRTIASQVDTISENGEIGEALVDFDNTTLTVLQYERIPGKPDEFRLTATRYALPTLTPLASGYLGNTSSAYKVGVTPELLWTLVPDGENYLLSTYEPSDGRWRPLGKFRILAGIHDIHHAITMDETRIGCVTTEPVVDIDYETTELRMRLRSIDIRNGRVTDQWELPAGLQRSGLRMARRGNSPSELLIFDGTNAWVVALSPDSVSQVCSVQGTPKGHIVGHVMGTAPAPDWVIVGTDVLQIGDVKNQLRQRCGSITSAGVR